MTTINTITIKQHKRNLVIPGATVLEEYCETPLGCCGAPAAHCEGLPPWPDVLYLTLSGWDESLLRCALQLDDVSVGLWDMAYGQSSISVAATGIVQKLLTCVNAWKNGSYQLHRITGNQYILADSATPFIKQGLYLDTDSYPPPFPTATPGGYSAGNFAIYSPSAAPPDNFFVSSGTAGDRELHFNTIDYPVGGAVYLSPTSCQYVIGCDADVVYYPDSTLSNTAPISFNQNAVNKWLAYANSDPPFSNQTLPFAVGSFLTGSGPVYSYLVATTGAIYCCRFGIYPSVTGQALITGNHVAYSGLGSILFSFSAGDPVELYGFSAYPNGLTTIDATPVPVFPPSSTNYGFTVPGVAWSPPAVEDPGYVIVPRIFTPRRISYSSEHKIWKQAVITLDCFPATGPEGYEGQPVPGVNLELYSYVSKTINLDTGVCSGYFDGDRRITIKNYTKIWGWSWGCGLPPLSGGSDIFVKWVPPSVPNPRCRYPAPGGFEFHQDFYTAGLVYAGTISITE